MCKFLLEILEAVAYMDNIKYIGGPPWFLTAQKALRGTPYFLP